MRGVRGGEGEGADSGEDLEEEGGEVEGLEVAEEETVT